MAKTKPQDPPDESYSPDGYYDGDVEAPPPDEVAKELLR
jgi:hypothetical protein